MGSAEDLSGEDALIFVEGEEITQGCGKGLDLGGGLDVENSDLLQANRIWYVSYRRMRQELTGVNMDILPSFQTNYPTFLVIGAMKAATSTVCAYLEDHPETYCVPHCEPNYFSHDHIYAYGKEWYLRFFEGHTNVKHRGEGSNYYSARALYPHAAERIFALNPNIKIIYMVRDPIKRILSAWIQRRADAGDRAPPTVDDAIRQQRDDYVGQSQYFYNIQPYLELFPKENIFLGFMEDLSSDSGAFWLQLCQFLDIQESPVQRAHVNPSLGKKVPSRLYTTLNKFPLVKYAKIVTPNSLKSHMKALMMTEAASPDVAISPAVFSEIREILEDDARKLLDYAGRPYSFWDLEVR